MAKATTAKAPKKKKAGKAAALKAKPDAPKKAKKKSKPDGKGIDMLWKLAEHPLIGELIAVGATAAVAAIAEQSIDRERKSKGKKSAPTKAGVKAAGSAAAAAIGQRLINEFTDIKKVAKKASA